MDAETAHALSEPGPPRPAGRHGAGGDARLREPGSGLAYARTSVVNGCRMAHRRSAVARRYAPRLAGPASLYYVSDPGPGRG